MVDSLLHSALRSSSKLLLRTSFFPEISEAVGDGYAGLGVTVELYFNHFDILSNYSLPILLLYLLFMGQGPRSMQLPGMQYAAPDLWLALIATDTGRY